MKTTEKRNKLLPYIYMQDKGTVDERDRDDWAKICEEYQKRYNDNFLKYKRTYLNQFELK